MNDSLLQDDSIPFALEFPISIGEPNELITLYEGRIAVKQGDNTYEVDNGHIFLKWLPSPSIRFGFSYSIQSELSSDENSLFLKPGNSLSLHLDNDINLEIEVTKTTSNSDLNFNCFSGYVTNAVIPPVDTKVNYVLFLLPNFRHHFLSEIVRYLNNETKGTSHRRISLGGSGWVITLDQVENIKNVEESLRRNSGFGITNIGRLEREDRKPFTSQEALKVLDALASYLSFAWGQWTTPCLPIGFDATGKQVWKKWEIPLRISPYFYRFSWLNRRDINQFVNPFPGFLKLWFDKDWQAVIQKAIVWYIESNKSTELDDGAIILTQAAFELLSFAILVEQYKWLNEDEHKNIKAAGSIRLLFKWANIPTNIPEELVELTKQAKGSNWSDTATAMTEIRNTITHPTKKNREKYDRHGDDSRVNAWNLGLWNLELVLLRLFEYEGTYSNRLKEHNDEQVPWSIPKP